MWGARGLLRWGRTVVSKCPPKTIAGKRGSRTPPAPELRRGIGADHQARPAALACHPLLPQLGKGRSSAVAVRGLHPWLSHGWQKNMGVVRNLWGLWASLHQALTEPLCNPTPAALHSPFALDSRELLLQGFLILGGEQAEALELAGAVLGPEAQLLSALNKAGRVVPAVDHAQLGLLRVQHLLGQTHLALQEKPNVVPREMRRVVSHQEHGVTKPVCSSP